MMVDKKLTELSSIGALDNNDLFLIVSDPSGSPSSRRITATNVRAYMTPFINVLDFGAVGDGETDDTDAIQDAIDYLPYGGQVYIPSGTYKITGLTISHPIRLSGAGYGHGELLGDITDATHIGTTLKFTETSGTAISVDSTIDHTGFGGVQFDNFKIVGNRLVGGATDGKGILLKGESGAGINPVQLTSVTLHNFLDFGEQISGSAFQVLHVGCHFTKNGNAQINIAGGVPSELVYVGCVIDSESITADGPETADGVQVQANGDSPKLYGCTIQQCVDGVVVEGSGVTPTPLLHGCHFEANTTAVHLATAGGIKMDRCYFVLNDVDLLVDTTANGYVAANDCAWGGTTRFVTCGAYSRVHITGNKLLSNYGTKFVDGSGKAYLTLNDTWRRDTVTMSYSETMTFDCGEAKLFAVALTGNITTMTITNPAPGIELTFRLVQDATGGRTVAWPASVKFAGGSFTLSGAGKADMVTLYWNGSNWIEKSRAQNI